MNPFIELMQAGAFIMLLFAAVLILVLLRNLKQPRPRSRWGPLAIGSALILFSLPIYSSMTGSAWFDSYIPLARIVAGVLLPVGLYLLTALSHNWRLDGPEQGGDVDR